MGWGLNTADADGSAAPGEERVGWGINTPDADGCGPDLREDLVLASVYHLP